MHKVTPYYMYCKIYTVKKSSLFYLHVCFKSEISIFFRVRPGSEFTLVIPQRKKSHRPRKTLFTVSPVRRAAREMRVKVVANSFRVMYIMQGSSILYLVYRLYHGSCI